MHNFFENYMMCPNYSYYWIKDNLWHMKYIEQETQDCMSNMGIYTSNNIYRLYLIHNFINIQNILMKNKSCKQKDILHILYWRYWPFFFQNHPGMNYHITIIYLLCSRNIQMRMQHMMEFLTLHHSGLSHNLLYKLDN